MEVKNTCSVKEISPAGMRRKAPMAVSAANRAVSTSGRTVLRAREEWVLFMKFSPFSNSKF